MKRFIKVFGVIAFIANIIFFVRASTTLIGSMVSVNGTTNSTSVNFGTYFPEQPTVFISNGGCASTNALTVNAQISLDNVNFITIGTYNPSVTNAATDTWRPALGNQMVYFRTQVVTTNATQVGIILQ